MVMSKYTKMVEQNKKESQEKIDRAIQAIKEMLDKNEKVVVCTLVKRTGLSRAFFYKNPQVNSMLETARKKQSGMPNVQKQKVILDKAMERQLSLYKSQIEKLQNENRELKKRNDDIGKVLQKRELDFIKGL